MRSPLNYLGGKSRMAERIVKQIPEHTCYCEPFCGASWVLFTKPPSKVEVINDRDCELVTFWRVVQNHLEEFLRYFKYSLVSRTLFELENRKDPTTLTDIQRAVRYYYLQRNGFGGITVARTFGTSASGAPRLNLTTIEEVLLEIHWRLSRVIVECLDACSCIERYDRKETFFYVDPPYYGTAGYAVPFVDSDYARLSVILRKMQGRFLLSLNDVPQVRKIFSGFRMRTIKTSYSISNGRSGFHGRHAPRSELLIQNFAG